MKKYIIISLIIIIAITSKTVQAYTMYSPASYHYRNNGTWERIPRKEVKLYRDYYDRNEHEPCKYYCYIRDYNMPNCDGFGYLIERSPYGTTGYCWQSYMNVRERIRCYKLDKMPIITDLRDFTDKRKQEDKIK